MKNRYLFKLSNAPPKKKIEMNKVNKAGEARAVFAQKNDRHTRIFVQTEIGQS